MSIHVEYTMQGSCYSPYELDPLSSGAFVEILYEHHAFIRSYLKMEEW